MSSQTSTFSPTAQHKPTTLPDFFGSNWKCFNKDWINRRELVRLPENELL